jgi:UDP-N-acetylmuramoylalanine--D-glutamate ligase
MSIVIAGKRVLVIGARRTGVALVRFLALHGALVRVSDRGATGFDAERKALAGFRVEWRLGEDGEKLLEDVDLVIPSPGVPRTAPVLRAAVRRGIPILSEIEMAFRFLSAPVFAITGTNGKSTTTSLLGAMLRAAGRRPFVGGNLGTPLIDAVGHPVDSAVVEVSSFQLEWIEQFRPAIGVFLNLTADHLDRYASLEEYGEAKAALFREQTVEDFAVLSREDPWVWDLRNRLRGRVVSFGFEPVEFGAFPVDGSVAIRLPGASGELRLSMARTRLRGVHNLENVMAASLVALLAGAPIEAVQEGVDEFPGLPHRVQLVRMKDGVSFVDDSKGTNVGAVAKSLASLAGPVILLAGGVDKGGSYEPLRSLVRERVKCLILFGEARDNIRATLGGETQTVIAADLEEAVEEAAVRARAGDTVLLSPACASFDMFRDYAERGDRFRELVEAL